MQQSFQPKISVILPAYNRPDYLDDAVGSILAQSIQDIELIIVNDGSTNPKVLSFLELAPALDERIRVYHQENQGPASARNTAIQKAQGKYIALNDDDDISSQSRLAELYRFLEEHEEYASVSTGMIFINEHGNKVGATTYRMAEVASSEDMSYDDTINFYHSVLINPTAMIRRKAILHVSCYREWFKLCEDVDLTLRMMRRFRLSFIPDQLYYYRTYRSSSQLSLNPNMIFYEAAALLSEYLGRERDDNELDIDLESQSHDCFDKLPPAASRFLMRQARGRIRKSIRDSDRATFEQLWIICKKLSANLHGEEQLRKIRRDIYFWLLRYMRPWRIK